MNIFSVKVVVYMSRCTGFLSRFSSLEITGQLVFNFKRMHRTTNVSSIEFHQVKTESDRGKPVFIILSVMVSSASVGLFTQRSRAKML